MIHQKSLDCVREASFGPHFCRPLYASYCFSRVPATIKGLLGAPSPQRLPPDTTFDKEYEQVVLFLLDGFGWRFFQGCADRYPFLQRIMREGVVTQLTAQFPSTTAAHVTCMNTGLTPLQSGVYEWFYYEPLLDCVIAPLTSSYAGDKQPGTLSSSGLDLNQLYPASTLYQELHAMGVASFAFIDKSIVSTPYSQAMFKGSQVIGYTRLKDGLDQLNQLLERQQGKKSYSYFYFPNIDTAGHHYGPSSAQVAEEIDLCFRALEEQFFQKQKQRGKVAILLIADHGMVGVDPKTTLYLNDAYPECVHWLQKNQKGELIVPAGSCRDFFLHIEKGCLEEAKSYLQERLQEKALVCTTKQLIEEGFFGEGKPSSVFLERVGNLVILPFHNHTIWWHEKNKFEMRLYGMHGGLSRAEMEIPFLFFEL